MGFLVTVPSPSSSVVRYRLGTLGISRKSNGNACKTVYEKSM